MKRRFQGKTIRGGLIANALLFAAPVTFAQIYLEPEDSYYQGRAMQDDILSGYHRDIVKKFSELYGWGVTFRAIILPSFETEYALGISSADENPKVVGGRAETQLYSYWWIKAHENQGKKYGARDKTAEAIAKLRSSILPTIDDVALTRCEISITDGDRSLYADLWRKELKETIEDALKLLIEQGELEPRWHALDRKARIARGRP